MMLLAVDPAEMQRRRCVCSFRWVCQCSRLTLRCVDVFVCVYVCACTESELMYVCVCVCCAQCHTHVIVGAVFTVGALITL